MTEKNEIMIIDEDTLRSKIYTIRGQQVMLDSDLAEIYGYETYKFNEQVKNNAERFEGEEFMFQLSKEEYLNLISKNWISSWGGRRKLPNAFTEQGIYMLMTILRGPLAIKQSRTLVRIFKSMKDYIIENQPLFNNKDIILLSKQTNENTRAINEIKDKMVTKNDLSGFIKLFDASREAEEILILDNELFKADVAYQRIYRKAKKSIIVIDDYINTKTLHHLALSKKNVNITIISDNKCKPALSQSEYTDFTTEYPGRSITFIRSVNKTHDRYIVLDNGTQDMKVYLCGSSSKDSGKKITTIMQVRNIDDYKTTIKLLLGNGSLVLR